ncbi:MAG: hypothetical protein DRN20_04805, partial [Thermoplasmata archaeon]
FNVHINAYYEDAENEKCSIWARNFTSGNFEATGYDVGNTDYQQLSFTLSPDFANETGGVQIKFQDDDHSSPGEAQGTLHVDYVAVRYLNASTLEHIWYLAGITTGNKTIYVEAYINSSAEGDEFAFWWSSDNSTWHYMFTVNATDADTLYSYTNDTLNSTTGTIYIKVNDTDRGVWNVSADWIKVDYICLNITQPVAEYSSLEHIWSFDIPSGATSVTFIVEANQTASTDGDNFLFSYSTDNITYTSMVTVSALTETIYSYEIDPVVTGTVYVKVEDTDSQNGNKSLDAVYVDRIYFVVGLGTTEKRLVIASGAGASAIGAGDVDNDGDNDIVAAKDGTILIYNNTDPYAAVRDATVWKQNSPITDSLIDLTDDYEYSCFVCDDINGDGYADMVVSGTDGESTNTYCLYLFLNLCNNTYYRICVKNLYTEIRGGRNKPGDITCIAVGPTMGWATTY